MFAFRNLLCAVLAFGVLFSATEAEARFGKRSNSSESEKKDKKKKKKNEDREERRQERAHDASPVGSARPWTPPPASPPPPPPRRVVVVETPPPAYHVAPTPSVRRTSDAPMPIDTRLGMDGGGMTGGVGLNFFLSFEGKRMGLDGRVLAIYLPTDDGTDGIDRLVVSGVNFTYAVIAQERLRLRMEAGVSVADAPDLKVVGPSLGTSLNAILAGPLDLELRLQGTPFPYRQLDAQAGLAIHLHALVVRGGWRTMLLNDAGLVDGEVHQDVLSGPYVGLGFTF